MKKDCSVLTGQFFCNIITLYPGGVSETEKKQKKGECMQADQKRITRLLKTARGQVDGILRMV